MDKSKRLFGNQCKKVRDLFTRYLKKNHADQCLVFSRDGLLYSYAFVVTRKDIHGCFIKDNRCPDVKTEFHYSFLNDVVDMGNSQVFLNLFIRAFNDLNSQKALLMVKEADHV